MTSMDAHFGRPNLLRNKDIRRRGANPLPLLLAQLLLRAGRPTVIDRTTSRPWASALFEGQRHTIWLRFSDLGMNPAAPLAIAPLTTWLSAAADTSTMGSDGNRSRRPRSSKWMDQGPCSNK